MRAACLSDGLIICIVTPCIFETRSNYLNRLGGRAFTTAYLSTNIDTAQPSSQRDRNVREEVSLIDSPGAPAEGANAIRTWTQHTLVC